MNALEPIELGWLVGIIEGEGCFLIHKSDNCVRVVVSMTDLDTIERLHGLTSLGNVTGPVHNKGERRPMWVWSVNTRSDVKELINLILPLLSVRRTERALYVLEHIAMLDDAADYRKKFFLCCGIPRTDENSYSSKNKSACKPCTRKRQNKKKELVNER